MEHQDSYGCRGCSNGYGLCAVKSRKDIRLRRNEGRDSGAPAVRNNAPRLLALLQKVDARHGSTHSEIAAIHDLFVAMHRELVTHMLKEEQVLFPYLCSMDTAVRAGQAPPQAFFGSVQNPITHMLADHDAAGDVLERISTLSNRYLPPPNACPTYTALYHGLAEFQSDLHRHVHLENNILFPRALEMEKTGK